MSENVAIDKLAWLPIRNRAVLFARSKGQTLFYCVGGKRKNGETDEEAVIREVGEETGVNLLPDTISYIHRFKGVSPGGRTLTISCYKGDGEEEPVASDEVEELAWFTTADMERTTEMGQEILNWLSQRRLID